MVQGHRVSMPWRHWNWEKEVTTCMPEWWGKLLSIHNADNGNWFYSTWSMHVRRHIAVPVTSVSYCPFTRWWDEVSPDLPTPGYTCKLFLLINPIRGSWSITLAVYFSGAAGNIANKLPYTAITSLTKEQCVHPTTRWSSGTPPAFPIFKWVGNQLYMGGKYER
jgi:hypothetical protein